MSPPTARCAGSARLAVIGAATARGARLREALAKFGMPGARVDLYGTTHGEVVLSEYDGEARLIQEPEPEEIAERDLVFLCESGPLVDGFLHLASRGTVFVDLAEAVPAGPRARLVHPDVNAGESDSHEGIVAVPHELAAVLIEVLHPLDRALDLEEAVAVVACPASDAGDDGVEELREQTVRLLNFGAPPVEVFGGQLAFNVIPRGHSASERRVIDEVRTLLGDERNRLALRTVTVPMFYGHAAQLRVRFKGEQTAERVRGVAGDAGLTVVEGAAGKAVTPMDVAADRKTLIADVSDDGLGGVWLWVVAGEVAVRRAELAVRLADRLCEL